MFKQNVVRNSKSSSTIRYIFGPVPSRRFGRSLGVDVTPHKTCSFDCIYCECGKTTHLTVKPLDKPAPELIFSELEKTISISHIKPDVITFSGAGEPTLYSPIGEIIALIKEKFPAYPVVVLTNSSLLISAHVRHALCKADIVCPSLDAPREDLFLKINRPHKDIRWNDLLEGLIRFKEDYKGIFRLEILFLKGLNDDIESVRTFGKLAQFIGPDIVDLNTLSRPGTNPHLKGLTEEELKEKILFFDIPCDVVGHYEKKQEIPCNEINPLELENNILNILKRRPCLLDEISDSLGTSRELVKNAIDALLMQKRVKQFIEEDKKFYFVSS